MEKTLTLLCAASVACTTLFGETPKPVDSLTPAPADGDTIVFLGDSITAQCLYTQYVEDYFFTRYPQMLHFRLARVTDKN